jgi:hypothetical protein
MIVNYASKNVSSWFNYLQDPEKMSESSNFSKFFVQEEIRNLCTETILPLIDKQMNALKMNYETDFPSRLFLYGIGQGADVANTCFLMYKGL